MGKEVVYCSVCGDRIPSSDLEKGRAAMVLRKYFCKKCALTVAKESSEGAGDDPSTTPSPLKIRTRRVPLADKPQPILSNRIPFLIAAAIGVVALILLLYVFFARKS